LQAERTQPHALFDRQKATTMRMINDNDDGTSSYRRLMLVARLRSLSAIYVCSILIMKRL
jgi:hypothetical protein